MEWFTQIAERYGFGAAVALLVLVAVGYAVRELWQENKAVVAREAGKRSEMRDAHEEELVALREEYATKLEQYAARLDTLQGEKQAILERWRDESKETVREVVTVAQEMKTAAVKTGDALGFLREALGREKQP